MSCRSLGAGALVAFSLAVGLVGCKGKAPDKKEPAPVAGEKPKQEPPPTIQAGTPPPPRQPGGHESPEAVLAAYEEATEKGDWKKRIDCLSPKAQREEAGIRARNGWPYLASLARNPDGPAAPTMRKGAKNRLEVMARHGLTPESTKHLAGLDSRRDRDKIRNGLLALIKDPGTFSVELLAAEEKDLRGRISPKAMVKELGMTKGKLTDVKVEGDKATGTTPILQQGKVQGQFRYEFVKVAGSWKIDHDGAVD
jgi:hypothetical protein